MYGQFLDKNEVAVSFLSLKPAYTISHNYIIAFDDKFRGGDRDFQDLVIEVDGVVPEATVVCRNESYGVI